MSLREDAAGVAGAVVGGPGAAGTPHAVWPGAAERPLETFRSASGRGLAVAWWAVSLLALADLALHGRDRTAASISLGIVATDLLVWLGGWRPAVVLYPHHVVLRGSVRDRVLRLTAITAATAVGPLRLTAGDRVFTAASIGSTVRERRRAGRASAAPPAGAGDGFGARRGGRLGALGGLGGLGGSGGAGSPGFDDSRMDAETRSLLVGRTAGAHAADRIADEATRARRRSDAVAGVSGEPAAVSAGRFAAAPSLAALGAVLVLVLALALG